MIIGLVCYFDFYFLVKSDLKLVLQLFDRSSQFVIDKNCSENSNYFIAFHNFHAASSPVQTDGMLTHLVL